MRTCNWNLKYIFVNSKTVQKEKDKVDKYVSEGIVFVGYDFYDYNISNYKGRIREENITKKVNEAYLQAGAIQSSIQTRECVSWVVISIGSEMMMWGKWGVRL